MKTYKFWNPDLVKSCISYSKANISIDPETCTVEEIEKLEEILKGNVSTTIELNDSKQAAAVANIILSEWNADPRYAEVSE
jgi:hypothetical protein